MELMLFTNNVSMARAAYNSKIDRVVIDLEQRGKSARQQGYHLEINDHKIEDIRKIKKEVPIKVMCRLNPLNDDSEKEIEEALIAGADVLMLPMFRTLMEVNQFLEITRKRAKTSLLFETKEALLSIDQFKNIEVNEIYVGLNDLGLAYKVKFQYELLTNGIVDHVRKQFPNHDFGFGGITILDKGFPLLTKDIIKELVRLNGKQVIIRRAFKKDILGRNMSQEVNLLKNYYREYKLFSADHMENEHKKISKKIKNIVEN